MVGRSKKDDRIYFIVFLLGTFEIICIWSIFEVLLESVTVDHENKNLYSNTSSPKQSHNHQIKNKSLFFANLFFSGTLIVWMQEGKNVKHSKTVIKRRVFLTNLFKALVNTPTIHLFYLIYIYIYTHTHTNNYYPLLHLYTVLYLIFPVISYTYLIF